MAIKLLILFTLSTYVLAATPLRNIKISTVEGEVDGGKYRLPTHIKPQHYAVTLEPDLEAFTFRGSVIIDAIVLESSNNITIHSNGLSYENGFIKVSINGTNKNVTIDTVEDLDFIILMFDDAFVEGSNIIIHANFDGILNDLNRGFYRSSYNNENNETRWMATTQFEPADARMAFPCFDEPAFKATFDIVMIRERHYHSLANMELVRTIDFSKDKEIDIFNRTIVMSTYLIAFVVSDYDHISDNNRQRVYSRPEAINNGEAEFALDMGEVTLKALEDFTGIKYSINKMDQISIPHFNAGAMENWGLVTYIEGLLLFKEGRDSDATKESVLSTIAHEFAHQWFGNLVSPKWWKFNWLNEGFATYFQYYISDIAKPSWRYMDVFAVDGVQGILVSDGTNNTRPMTFEVGSPSEISSIFDGIAYSKSGSVFRMLQNAIGHDLFQKGLQIYLTKRQYAEATSDDLWSGFQEAISNENSMILPANKTVQDIMRTWETQMGYPVVFVTRNAGEIILSQKRFIMDDTTHTDESKWYVPINYATNATDKELNFDSSLATHWISPDVHLTTIDINMANNDWVIMNKQFGGYYRINYEAKNWELIFSYMNEDISNFIKIHYLNRAEIVDDSLNLARAGFIDYDVSLNALKSVNYETDYMPLKSFYRAFTFIDKMVGATSYGLRLKNYVSLKLNTAFKKLGPAEISYDDTEHVNNIHRSTLIHWACYGENDVCRDSVLNLENLYAVSGQLQKSVFCGALRGADEETWNVAKDLTMVPSSISSNLYIALGCTHNADILKRYIDDDIALGSTYAFRNAYTQSTNNIAFCLQYIIDNINNIYNKLDATKTNELLLGFASVITTADQLDKFKELENMIGINLNDILQQCYQISKPNIEWTNKYASSIERWVSLNA